MATASVKTVSHRTYTLELSENEAKVIRAIIAKVGGNFDEGAPRSAMHEVALALDAAGMTYNKASKVAQDANGHIMLGDNF